MNRLIVIIAVYSLGIIAVIFFIINWNNQKEVNLVQGEEYAQKVEAALKSKHTEEEHDGPTHQENDEIVEIFQNIESTIDFFVSVLKENNEEYFASMFLPQQYSDDLWAASDDPFKDKTGYKFMREMNRDGTLVSAKYNKNLMEGYKTNRKDSEVTLELIYKDGKTASLLIDFALMGTEHSNKDDIYYIKNSVLDLIDEIKRQTK
jgi:hypothetical protein